MHKRVTGAIVLVVIPFLLFLVRATTAGSPGMNRAEGERPLRMVRKQDKKSAGKNKITPPASPKKEKEKEDEKPTEGRAEGRTGLLLVNKRRSLPADYVPADLKPAAVPFTCPADSPKRLLCAEAAAALERLFAQAAKDGIELVGVSGYRSYERQREIFAAHVNDLGEEAANRVSARPGESEHQTGLAVDVSSPEAAGLLVESFGETAAGRWLAQNAPRFGFIIRYPRGKEEVTGYAYEPWHLRYVGVEHALVMAERGLTLEEYLTGRAD